MDSATANIYAVPDRREYQIGLEIMSQKLIVTNIMHNQKEYTACALYEENRLLEVSLQPSFRQTEAAGGECGRSNASSETKPGTSGILGNIYVGRVKDIVKNLNAAFIEIAPGVPCYYSLEDLQNPVFVKKINSPRLVQGDELLVQVVKESMKTKPPQVTTNLNFPGKYLALTTGNRTLGISKKLDKDTRTRLKSLLEEHKSPDYGLVVRTNSQSAGEEQILEELAHLEQQAKNIVEKAPYQTCFSCMMKQKPEFLTSLQNVYTKELEAIITDDQVLYEAMKQFLTEQQQADLDKLRFYEDTQLPLSKCYSLEVKLEDALRERVWLKSGGYLIIQPTEAFTVIDVNSGKSASKKDVQEHYLKVNLEAAAEIAAQMRLRNISGIIIVDFIDMVSEEARQQLMESLRHFTRQDPIPVQVVDMTKLNLVEMTRKKVKKSLAEQLK